MALNWKDQLQNKLVELHGNKKGATLGKKYLPAYPPSYIDEIQSMSP